MRGANYRGSNYSGQLVHKNVFRWHGFAAQQWSQAFAGALIWFGLTQEIEQSRKEVDMTHRLNNPQALALAGQSNKIGNAHRFFEHDFFSKQMMRPKHISVIAGVDNNGFIQ